MIKFCRFLLLLFGCIPMNLHAEAHITNNPTGYVNDIHEYRGLNGGVTGQDSPEIVVDPTALSAELQIRKTKTESVTVANNGKSELTWDSDIRYNSGNLWLYLSESSGEIEAGASATIDVTFDAFLLDEGTYTADIAITSNDPATPEVVISVTLIVKNIPDIGLSWADIDFDNTAVGQQSVDSMMVYNNGTAALTITNIISSVTDFVPEVEEMTIPAGEWQWLRIFFSPTAIGRRTGTLTITSNDPDEGEVAGELSGVGIEAPSADISPITVAVQLNSGETSSRQLNIINTGFGSLSYTSTVNFESTTTGWLSLDPASGVVAAGTSASVTVSINANNLAAGNHTAAIVFTTNDPARLEVVVTVSVQVCDPESGPEVVNPVASLTVDPDGEPLIIDLENVFSSSAGLTFTAVTYNEAVAAAEVSGSALLLTPLTTGVVVVEVLAFDGNCGETLHSFVLNVEHVTGLSAEESPENMRVYPNPANYKGGTLEVFSETAGEVAISLWSVSGSKVRDIYSGMLSPGTSRLNFPTSDIRKGVYFIKVLRKDGITSARLIIE